MNVITRGIKNAFRNWLRTISIVIILGISVGLALSMLVARGAVDEKIASVKANIGNTITVSPAGARGFEGGGEALTTDGLAKVANLANVTSVTESLRDRLTTDNTSLQSAVDAGSLGNRARQNSGAQLPQGDFGASGSGTVRSFTPPVTVTGVSSLASQTVYGGDSVTYTSGAAFDPTKDDTVAVVGKALASKNSLTVGSTFTAYGTSIKVVGIYDAGNTFANNGVIIPLVTLQRLSSQPGEVTSATVATSSVDTIDSVVANIKSTLGSTADVTSDQATAATAVEPLESVKTIALYGVIGAAIAGAIIILLTMIMIVRERRREIGVMKAIGSTNAKTVTQFTIEALTLTAISLVVGFGFAALAAQPLTNVLVNNSSSTTTAQAGPGFGRRARPGGNAALRGIQTVQASVGAATLGYGVGLALLIAIIGSAVPAYLISKVRPAEVMRAE